MVQNNPPRKSIRFLLADDAVWGVIVIAVPRNGAVARSWQNAIEMAAESESNPDRAFLSASWVAVSQDYDTNRV